MHPYSPNEVAAALKPLSSLISKSEKAQQKLTQGTWQHSMLQANLKALHIACALMNEDARFALDEISSALQSTAAMIEKTEKAQAGFAAGTSQHTLLRNRLAALRMAQDYLSLSA